MSAGQKIIESLEAAVRGDFTRVTTGGHVWVRDGVDKAAAWDAVIAARADEREKCAKLAEDFGWTIPMYSLEAKVNEATDEVACMVSRQIADAIRANVREAAQ